MLTKCLNLKFKQRWNVCSHYIYVSFIGEHSCCSPRLLQIAFWYTRAPNIFNSLEHVRYTCGACIVASLATGSSPGSASKYTCFVASIRQTDLAGEFGKGRRSKARRRTVRSAEAEVYNGTMSRRCLLVIRGQGTWRGRGSPRSWCLSWRPGRP